MQNYTLPFFEESEHNKSELVLDKESMIILIKELQKCLSNMEEDELEYSDNSKYYCFIRFVNETSIDYSKVDSSLVNPVIGFTILGVGCFE